MNAVIVDGDISYPATSGKRLRTLNLMLRLARRHRVTYLCRGDARGDEVRRAREFLGDHGVETVVVDHPVAHKSGPLFYARLAANLLSPLPYSVASHQSRLMREAVARHAARRRVDVWQLEWTPYLASLADCPGARTVLAAHNVDSLIWQRYHEAEENPLRRWYVLRQWRKFERFERQAFRRATWVVAVSPQEAALVRGRFGMPRVEVVENGIDREYFEAVRAAREATCILFLGALDWRPNLDAVGLLLDRIFPAVLAREPSARLCIVGRSPPPSLRERAGRAASVELHADVADVRPFLARCGVMAVPLRIGGGSRLKILEALACGLPVVSTTVGAEGLALRPGEDYLLADGPDAMAQALAHCLRFPESARATAERGRRVVYAQYDWDALADKLERVWEKAAGKAAAASRPTEARWSLCS